MEHVSADSEKKLNWREACALLGCKKSHFYNLVNSGKIPAIRTGEIKGVRVLESDCMEYMRSQCVINQ